MTSNIAADPVAATQAADGGGALVEPGLGVCSGDLTHLHPAIRDLARADDATRHQAIRSKRWITHPLAVRVLTALEETFTQPKGDRMENLLLVAESGMGKTMLLRKFQRDHAVPPDAASGVQRHPVVLTLMPEEPSEEAFYVQILKAVGAPVVLTTRRHRLGTRETTFRLLRELGARMLMIDEINSVLVGSARQQRYFLQLLRCLSNELQVAIVCAPSGRSAACPSGGSLRDGAGGSLRSAVRPAAAQSRGRPGVGTLDRRVRVGGFPWPCWFRACRCGRRPLRWYSTRCARGTLTSSARRQRQNSSPARRTIRWHHLVDLPGTGTRRSGRDPHRAGAHRPVWFGRCRDLAWAPATE